MTCYGPLIGYWSNTRNPKTGKRFPVFKLSEAYTDMPIKVPCGSCVGCRMEKARQWAIRMVHEAKSHETSSFLTLTFDDQALRKRGHTSLDVADIQLFMKRLRRRVEPC